MDELSAWLTAHMVFAAAAAVVGPTAGQVARSSAQRCGQHNLVWSLDHYAAAKKTVPDCVAAALAASTIDPALAAALRKAELPPKAGPGGITVAARHFPMGPGVSARPAQAYWLLHHPATGIAAAFEDRTTAPAVVDGVFSGKWKDRRCRALRKAVVELS